MFSWLRSFFHPAIPEPVPPPATAAEALERWRRAVRPAEQVSALEALAAFGEAEGKIILQAALKTAASAHTRIAAARLLAEAGSPGAAFLLREAAKKDAEPLVRAACENALKKLDPKT